MNELRFTLFFFLIGNMCFVIAQQKIWTEKDREYLVENMERTKCEVIRETENLSLEQWMFKPDNKSWSIAQVVEHLGLYERIIWQEAMVANVLPPRPELHRQSRSDSEFIAYMAEKEPHIAPKNATPLGLIKGSDNLSFFIFGRDLIIEFLKETERDLKAQFTPRSMEPNKFRSIHGLMVVHFGHTERHLRQIARIKSAEAFPIE